MTRATCDPVTLPDARLSALLKLAQWAAEQQADAEYYDAPAIAAGLVPHITPEQAALSFELIVSDIVDATAFDTRGADEVIDRFGRWDATVGMDADEKASEERDRLRESARFAA